MIIIYSVVIFLSCVLGAIVGLGGGVFIRPVFDAIDYHNVMNIAFFSSMAILTMAVVSTIKKMKDGLAIKADIAVLISGGAVVGGFLGNLLLEYLVDTFALEANVQLVQIIVTVLVLAVSIFATLKRDLRYEIKLKAILPVIGVGLGAVAAFLGIGGGPINVPILMIFFGLPIKTATMYSIVIIFFSHASRLITMGFTTEGSYLYFDLRFLPFVVAAAAVGGLVGANLSRIFSDGVVKKLFISALCAVIILNLYNGVMIVLQAA
jgi:uncharacterized membrane protein YfcA